MEMKPNSRVRFVYAETSDFAGDHEFYNNIETVWYETHDGSFVEEFADRLCWNNITRDTEKMKEFVLAKIGAINYEDLE